MSNQNSNLAPSYNSNIERVNNMNEITRHSIDFQSQIIKRLNKLKVEELIFKKYGRLDPSFLFNHNVLNIIRELLDNKYNKTISKNETKILRNLQKKLYRFIELDIQYIFINRQHLDTIKKLDKARKKFVKDFSIPYLKTLNKEQKKKIKPQYNMLKNEISYLRDLEKILRRKLNSIYEQFTKLLNTGTLLLNERGNHFVDDTNFMDPTLDIHYNTFSKKKKKYTDKPPSYKESQRITEIERKIVKKWMDIIKSKHNSNSYYTANENMFHSANENTKKQSNITYNNRAGPDPLTVRKTHKKKKKKEAFNKKHSHKPPGKKPKYFNSNNSK